MAGEDIYEPGDPEPADPVPAEHQQLALKSYGWLRNAHLETQHLRAHVQSVHPTEPLGPVLRDISDSVEHLHSTLEEALWDLDLYVQEDHKHEAVQAVSSRRAAMREFPSPVDETWPSPSKIEES